MREVLLAYCGLAVLVTVSNKYILLNCIPHGYTCNLFILFMQSWISLVVMNLCKYAKILTYKPFDKKYLTSWIPIIIFLILSIYSNGKSVQLLPISTFNVLKNIGLLLTIVGDVIFFGRRLNKSTYMAVSIVLLTSIIHQYVKSQEAFYSAEGVTWTIVNCIACSLYGLYVKYHRTCYQDITNVEYVYYNNLLTTPVIAVLSFYFEDSHKHDFTGSCAYVAINNGIAPILLFSSVLTFLITLVIVNIHMNVSSTTYAIVASLNKLPMSFVSMLIFQDDIATWTNFFFVCLSVIASIFFVKYA